MQWSAIIVCNSSMAQDFFVKEFELVLVSEQLFNPC
jgi:hypothetical protein